MSTDEERIRDGTLGVRWIATVVMEILLFVSSFDVNQCLNFFIVRKVCVHF